MIKVIEHEDDRTFLPAVVKYDGQSMNAKFHKCPETGVIDLIPEDYDDFPFSKVVTLTVNDGNDSSYTGIFDNESGEFQPV